MTAQDYASVYGFLSYAIPLCITAAGAIILWMRKR